MATYWPYAATAVELDPRADALIRQNLHHCVRKGEGQFNLLQHVIKAITMHGSKELDFTVVAVVGGATEEFSLGEANAEARLIYVAAARAVQDIYLIRQINDRSKI